MLKPKEKPATNLNVVRDKQLLVDALNALAEAASYVKEGYTKTLVILIDSDNHCVFVRANVDELETVGLLTIANHMFLDHARETCDD